MAPTTLLAGLCLLGLVPRSCGFLSYPARRRLPIQTLRWSGPDDASESVEAFFEPESDKSILCVREFEMEVDGESYAVGVPVDVPATICTFNAEGELEALPREDALHDELVSLFERSLDDYGVALLRTPLTLTIQGEMDDLDEEDEEDEEGEEDDELWEDVEEDDENIFEEDGEKPPELALEGDGEDGDVAVADTATDNPDEEREWEEEDLMFDEEEQVDLVAAVDWEGTRYNLVQLLEPVIIVGKKNAASGRLEIPSTDELETIFPLIEAQMEIEGAKEAR